MSVVPLYQQTLLLVSIAVLFGLLAGSFINVVIHRVPRMMERQWRVECAEITGTPAPAADPAPYNLMVPRSACPHCGHGITALENIPIASYIALGGKCSACKKAISPRYPIVEGIVGALAGFVAWRYGLSVAMFGALLFAGTMVALAFIDLDTFYLPDSITLPLLWAGLLLNTGGVFTDLGSAVFGAAAGYLVLWSVYWLFKFATGKEGMGYGDFKLLAAIGAWLGWKMLPLVILSSSLVGAIVGIILIAFARHGRNVPIPFGPYLAAAGLIGLFWGEPLTQRYLNLF
jgi:leader peptidase (prepilin peptidase) / N-methyltransferase